MKKMTTLLALLMVMGCGKGKDGVNGSQGVPGDKAVSCSVLPVSGGVEIDCPDGTHEALHNGVDGTQITVVQLCPGTPVYPSVFIEIALCIQDALYAVYSANGGFLTLLSPGGYGSNAIGSSCGFTVGPHCQVTN